MSRTYYDLLGVTPDADTTRVRAAYRDRVKEVHPDVSEHPDAAERFRRLTAAKETLCDPEERARYDRLGHEQYVTSRRGPGHKSEDDPGRTEAAETATEPSSAAGETESARAERRARQRAEAWAADTDAGHAQTSADGGTARRGGHAASNRSRSWYRPGAGDGSGYRVSTRIDTDVRFTTGRVLFAVAVSFCYPLLLGVTVLPMFGPGARAAAGVLALVVVVNTLSIPESAVLVFGALTLAAPVALAALGVSLLSITGTLAWAFCWVPFVLGAANLLALRA